MRSFLFTWERCSSEGDGERWLVIFLSRTVDEYLPLLVGEHIESNPAYSRILLVSMTYNKAVVDRLLEQRALHDRLPTTFRSQPPEDFLSHWTVEQNGMIRRETGELLDAVLAAEFFRAGAEFIFFDRSAKPQSHPILEAPIGFHFVKPSKRKHSTHFIRTAEILTDGAEIEFLATSLFRFVTEQISCIACDTGSIAVVAYALQTLMARFLGDESGAPYLSVISFGSWSGFRNDTSADSRSVGQTRFTADPTTLYIISASTGGALAAELERAGVDASRIVTLYFVGEVPSAGAVVCEVKQRRLPTGSLLLPTFGKYLADQCPLCQLSSTPLELRGDQFLPTGPSVTDIELRLEDTPRWIASFVKSAAGTGAIRAHFGHGSLSRIHEIFIHVEALCDKEGTEFRLRLQQAINQAVPFGVQRIYVCDDQGSLRVLARVKDALQTAGLKLPEVIQAAELERDPNAFKRKGGIVLVIAGCVSSGRSVVKISRLLRVVEDDGAISYLIALRRTRSREEEKHLESTLRQTNGGRIRYGFQSVQDLIVPDNTPERDSVWSSELELLRKVLSENAGLSGFPTQVVARRIERLEKSIGDEQRGLCDDLFWPSTGNAKLALRPNFAFVGTVPAELLTQADVFFVISALLHRLRSGTESRILHTSEHRRTLLNPSNFQRFSDGVIQASLLRASHRKELDCELKASFDSAATALITDLVASHSSAHGEAAIEFLLALALGQVRLSKEGTGQVVAVAEAQFPDPSRFEHHLAKIIRRDRCV